MKRFASLLVLFLLTAMTVVTMAAPLHFEPQQVRQPDGSTLKCFASGDEFSRRLHDANDYTIIQDPASGWFVYARLVKGKLVPTPFVPGKDNPSLSGLQAGAAISGMDIARTRHMTLAKGASTASAPKTGTINNLVIYIRFSGEAEFADSLALYDRMFNSNVAGTNSVRNYFLENSYGQLTVSSTFYPQTTDAFIVSYQDPQPRSYYQPYNATTNPGGYQTNSEMALREHTLLMNAVAAVETQIPSSLNIDGNMDGYVDNATFIVAGTADATSGILWPHKWSCYMQTVYVNGARIYDYNLQLQNSVKASGVGVLVHELLHSVGVPDMYHYTNNGVLPVASWDVMENNLNPPQHINAYSKYRYTNWIASIPEITTSGTYYVNAATSATGQVYKVASTNPNEFYIIEYRRKTGTFENSLPGSGLVVYRVNTTKDGLGNAGGPVDEIYVYRPNGTNTANGTPSSAFFNSSVGRNKFNSTTNPTPFLADGSLGGLNISYIGSAGTTIAFTISITAPVPTPPLATTVLSPANAATDVTIPVSLSWNPASGNPTGYKVYVGTDNPPTNAVNGTLVTGTSYSFSAAEGTSYNWMIVPTNGAGDATSCPVWSFTTISYRPFATTAIAPVNGATNVLAPVTLSWNPASGNPTGYKVYVGTDYPPTNAINGTLVSETSFSFTADDGVSYNWMIVPTNASGDATDCPVWNFSTRQALSSFPYVQSFPSVPPTGWSRNNTQLWTATTVTQRTGSNGVVAKADCWNAAKNSRTQLVSETFNISGLSSPTLKFYVSHRPRTGYSDTLQVRFSTDFGATWSTGSPALYRKASATLATGTSMTKAFTPSSSSNWRCETVNLSAFAGAHYLTIAFEAYCGDGNNIFLDDVTIQDGAAPIRVLAGGSSANDNENPSSRPSVDLIGLTATALGESVQLDWSSSLLGVVDGFTIERSADGREGWTDLGFVDAESGSTLRFVDNTPLAGTSYYRLVVEQSEGARQSQVVRFHRGAIDASVLTLYPSPLVAGTAALHVSFQALQSGASEIRLYDAAGRSYGTLWEGQAEAGTVRTVSLRTADLAAGHYLLEFRNGAHISTTHVPVIK